jgi:serine/threonine kinase 38
MEGLSKQQQEKIAFAKQYIENKYSLRKQEEELQVQHWAHFEERMEALGLSEAAREQLRAEVKHKHAEFYRQRRVKMTPNDFESVAVIGRGAFGEVRLCKDKASGDLVAVKRLKKQEMKQKNQVGHIKAERNILAASDNPWIVQLKYSFQDASSLYLVM